MHHELETLPDPDAPALARARQILWLVTGADKKAPLARLLVGETTIPAGRVEAAASLVVADRAAIYDAGPALSGRPLPAGITSGCGPRCGKGNGSCSGHRQTPARRGLPRWG